MQRLVIEPRQLQGELISLDPAQQHYLYRVLRLGLGSRFVAMDGGGNCWLAQLQDNQARVLEPIVVSTELPVSVTLIAALPKGNGFDEVVRCATELGVTTIQPVISDRTLLKPSPHKLERWRRIVAEASEQSERQLVPHLCEPRSFASAIETFSSSNNNNNCYLALARQDCSHLLHYLQVQEGNKIVIATGPEGGWTTKEVEIAVNAGFQPVSLGRRILRAVTAPIVALSLVAAIAEK